MYVRFDRPKSLLQFFLNVFNNVRFKHTPARSQEKAFDGAASVKFTRDKTLKINDPIRYDDRRLKALARRVNTKSQIPQAASHRG